MGAVMLGASLEHITCLARRKLSQLHHDDDVILGGANDINTNESKLVSNK